MEEKTLHGIQKHAFYSLYCLTFIALDRNFFPESEVLPRHGFSFVSFLTQNTQVYIMYFQQQITYTLQKQNAYLEYSDICM